MNSTLDLSIPGVRWRRNRYGNHSGQPAEEGFKCGFCRAHVHTITMLSGVQNRNHCPYCLRSRHLDLHRAGDRLSACKAIMQPIGLTVKAGRSKYDGRQPGELLAAQAGEPHASHAGELMLVHLCSQCGELSLNRIAADDMTDVLLGLMDISTSLDEYLNHKLGQKGIRLLRTSDKVVALKQLYGNPAI